MAIENHTQPHPVGTCHALNPTSRFGHQKVPTCLVQREKAFHDFLRTLLQVVIITLFFLLKKNNDSHVN